MVNGTIPGSTGTFSGFEQSVSKPVHSSSFGIGGGINSVIDAVQGVELGIAVSGGVGGGSSTATSKRSFLDINGDGLVDIVQVDENNGQTYVKYNLGNRFGNSQSLNVSLAEESKTHSGYANLNGGFYVNIPAITIFGITLLYLKPFGGDLTANVGLSVSEINKGLRDVNGDGYPDLLINSNSGLQVYYSQAGMANKLRKVSYSQTNDNIPFARFGTAFNINYSYSKPSYNDPQAKVVMSSVELPNPDAFSSTYTSSTNNKNIISTFEYENSRYDRREREKYGFEKVTIREMLNNSTVHRTTVQTFYNQNYFVRGLLKSSQAYSGSTSNLLSSSFNTYKLYNFNSSYNEIVELPSAQFETYDIGGTEGRRMARALLASTVKNNYEAGNFISVQNQMSYNNKGQLIKYQYTSPSITYNSSITYHNNLGNNIKNVPSSIIVYEGTGSSNPLRKRATEIQNLNTGDITKVKVWLTSSEISETDLEYDIFGNIKTVKYPPNENMQRSELEYFYDPMGKYVIQVKDPIFNLSSYASYNPLIDAITQSTDVAGNMILYGYDPYGRLSTITGPNEITAGTNTIMYSYFNSPVTLGNGNSLHLFGAKTIHVDPYHPNNNIETISFADVTGEVIQVKKDIEIDGAEKMSVSGRVINDNLGRSIMQYHPIVENKDATINAKINLNLAQHFTSSIYDHKDRVVTSTDEAGNSVDSKFFVENTRFKTETTQWQNTSTQLKTEVYANAEGKTVHTINYLAGVQQSSLYTYNTVGELVRVIDPGGMETLFDYDMGGRRIYQNHPDRGITTYQYSKVGQLTHLLNNNLNNNGGTPIHYVYSYNRLTNITLPDIPSGPNPANVYYAYGNSGNNAGRIWWKSDGTGFTMYEYGKMGEVLNENRFIYGFYMPTLNFTTSYEYDSWNRIRNITYPDGEIVNYQYDLGGNLNRIFNDSNYEYVKSIKYDEYEQRTSILYGNDTSSSFAYEPAKRRLSNHVLLDANSNELLNGTYDYDYVSNIKSITNTSPTTNFGFGGNYTFNYQYDTLNRLTRSYGNGYANKNSSIS